MAFLLPRTIAARRKARAATIAPLKIWLDIMGFEQLAALKAQLAKQAKQEKQAKQAPAESRTHKPRPRPATKAATTPPVDPVVLVIGKLQARFPMAFPKKPAAKVPLKIGIFEDLLPHAAALALNEAELRAAIRTWCRGQRYQACMVEGAARVDLAGQEAGQVTQAEAKRAQYLQASQARRARQQTAQPPKAE